MSKLKFTTDLNFKGGKFGVLYHVHQIHKSKSPRKLIVQE